jgi:hypothetical protein
MASYPWLDAAIGTDTGSKLNVLTYRLLIFQHLCVSLLLC